MKVTVPLVPILIDAAAKNPAPPVLPGIRMMLSLGDVAAIDTMSASDGPTESIILFSPG